MNRNTLTARLNAPVSRVELIRNFCRGKTVLDIGCVQHDAANVENSAWLHQAIVDVAASAMGVDYAEEHVARLKALGYNVLSADITRPLPIDTRFDVIVVGNLIEHLSNFEGLLNNIRRLLKADGCVLISTANPFYREQYFYTAFKNDILVNPEHTCWFDPVTLDQLCARCGLATHDVYWVKEKWKLGQVIVHGKTRFYDMFTGRWTFNRPPTRFESALSCVLEWAFRTFFSRNYSERIFKKHGPDTRRLLYLKLIEKAFQSIWALYSVFIVSSAINKYELFVTVLRPVTPPRGGMRASHAPTSK